MKFGKLEAVLYVVFNLLVASPAVAQWQTSKHSVPIGQGAGVTGFGSAAPGTAGQPLVSNGPNADPSFQSLLSGSSVVSIAALRALPAPLDGTAIEVMGYYLVGDSAGGRFLYSAASTAADNGGTIIAPTSGTGRYVRQTPYTNRYTPEMFGANHNGTDDQVFVNNAVAALNALPAGGTLWLTDGYVYTVGPSLATTQATVKELPGVSWDGTGTLKLGNNSSVAAATFTGTCSGTTLTATSITGTIHANDFLFGAGMPSATQVVSGSAPTYVVNQACTSSSAALTSTTKFVRMVEAVSPISVGRVSFKNITLDYNGANNSCGGTCWAFNAMLSVQVGDDVTVSGVRFLNNSGSNDTEFGTNVLPATVTNLSLTNNIHENSGDRVNAASADFSADFFIAQNVVLSGNRYYNGPAANGSAFEAHGSVVAVSNLVIDNYMNCGIISNETASPGTNNVTLSNVSCLNVSYGGVQFYSFPGGTSSVNVSIDNLQVLFLTGHAGYGVDACTEVDASSTNINFSINKLTYFSDVTSSLGNDTSGACLANFVTANVTNSQFYHTQGPGIRFKSSSSGASLSASGNQIVQPGNTATTTLQAGIVLDASANTAANINLQNNPISGAVRYGVIGAVNATGGAVFGNPAPGATVAPYNWTGTGITPGAAGVACTGTPTSSFATIGGVVTHC